MIGYEGRRALLDDADEWVNIPFVVREFMKQLNDEAQASRAMMETLRREQKENNLLLRRVMQKQADLDIDNTRNIMSLSHQASRAALHSTEKRHAEQLQSLRKKTERLEDKMQHISAQVEELSQVALSSASTGSAFGELKGLVTTLNTKTETTERLLRDHIDAYTVGQKSTESLVNAAALAAVTDFQKALKDQLNIYRAEQSGLEKSLRLLQEASTSQKEESSRIRGICGELSQVLEADRKTSTDRLTSCFNTVEKLEKLCVAHHAALEARLKRTEEACVERESIAREEAKSLYAELRGVVKGDQAETQQRCYELAEELRMVKEQQRRLTEQLTAANHESESVAQRGVKQIKDIAARLASLETEVEQFSSSFVARRDHQKEQRQTQDSLDAVRSSVTDTVASFQAQVQHLAASLKTMRAEQGEDNDWLHNELGRIGTIVGYASQQHGKQERQVTSLCEIVHNLSVAVEGLQKGCGTAAAPSSAPAASVVQANPPEGGTKTEVPAAWETWRLTLVKDIEEKIAAAVPQNTQPHASPPVLERVSQQLNELTAKVDGGAKYTHAIISQQMDQMRQTVKDEVTHQLQSHSALREAAPALVEVEAVKRRVAGIELDLQTLSTRAERSHTDSEGGNLSSANAVVQRLHEVEEAVDDFRRRLLELGEHVIGVDQRSSELARSGYDMEAQLQDQQRIALKLGADLTEALERLLQTEQSLSRYQSMMTLQLSEVRACLEKWKCDAAAAPTAAAPSVEPSARVQNGVASSGANADGALMSRSASVAHLTETVERLCAQVTRMEAETLQAVRADLEAIRNEGTAATVPKIRTDDAYPTSSAALDAEGVHAIYEKLQRRLGVEESSRREAEATLRAVEARLLAVETCVSELLSSPTHGTSPPAGDAGLAATKAAVANFSDELARCHERLDSIQEQLSSSACRCSSNGECARELEREAQRQDVHHLQQQLGQLQGSMHAFVASQLRTEMCGVKPTLIEAAAAAAVLCCEDMLRASAASAATAVDAQAYTEGLRSLRVAVEEIQRRLEERISSVLEGRHRVENIEQELRTAAEGLKALEKTQSELRCGLESALSAHESHQRDLSRQLEAVVRSMEANIEEVRAEVQKPTAVPTAEPGEVNGCVEKLSDDEKAAWAAEVVNSMEATYYTRTLLEERLENIWSSMISLLTRKEDVSAVHEKLNGLHQLMQEELQIELQRLEEQMANQLAEKVSLANLQDILERHIANSDTDSDGAVL
ncbi:hypothetical protein LSCM1_04244 [Leishmania martiniquensis]|uniref:Uncharacterized protein n=1 Tax=Leishmania martiniquensis TaxID=1580590 RepID=A0A836HGR1_9TRYP|nr:hypothetical protein LSCM1_04244 [Leishmania martiniquensis]